TVLISNSIARIYHQRQCVATHVINQGGLYITQSDHLASTHKAYLDNLSPEVLKEKARALGPEVESLIVAVLKKGLFPEHAYRTSQGCLALQCKCQRDLLRICCEIALACFVTSRRFQRQLVTTCLVTFQGPSGRLGRLSLLDNIGAPQLYQWQPKPV